MTETKTDTLGVLNKYKIFIGIGIAVAVSIASGTITFVKAKSRKEEAAWQSMWRINNDLAKAVQSGKTEKDKNEALNNAIEAFKYVEETSASSGTMPWILFQMGNIYYDLKKYDEAIRSYNDFLQRYSGHPIAFMVKQSLGYAYEEKGLLQEAGGQFNDAVLSDKIFLLAQQGWDAGRCYDKLGQKENAIRSYTKAIDTAPDSIWASLSRYRLSIIK
ncbi:MAG: tetratricopeptide repeat protein [Planctomycetes bacterium]|nr:tetratricopeptide repeat protein [Planctomycetota bacterium]